MPRILRVLIVDDEAPARARARRLLEALPDLEIVGEAGSAAEARERIAALTPDLLLLDIQMPGEDGFELLRTLAERPAVIFATAFDHYAVQAFEERAIDYLLKPFRAERLAEALDRVRAARAGPESLDARMRELLDALAAERSHTRTSATPTTTAATSELAPLERLTVRVGVRQRILRAEEILWFGAEDKLVFVAIEGDRFWINFTLDQLEARLDARRFLRVHRGAIVNLDHALELRPAFAGTWRLTLRDTARTEVPVSRTRARPLRERLGAR
ncbi:MAG: response regulator transcription factor [Candidatus Eisenbacteria bacterium]|uniref:Response regulator transcription factor n=1 Tax=Eiseniibacteriota bacterium TaxID=2212470 RepID=A0A849SU92_UNCEI|nr:response regulator transcription factor [Candidatus Eisenbacteria bacterium]